MEGALLGSITHGCAGTYLLPVFGDRTLPVYGTPLWGALLSARSALDSGDGLGASATLAQLDAEASAHLTPDAPDVRTAARIDGGVAAWWAGDIPAAAAHFREAAASDHAGLRDRARLNLACCQPDPEEADTLLRGLLATALAPEATLARAALLAPRDPAGAHRILGRLDDATLPEGARPYALVNRGALAYETGDYATAFHFFTRADAHLTPGADHARAVLLLNWGTALVLDAAARAGAEQARRWTHAETLLVDAADLLRQWAAPPALVGDALRTLGVLHHARARTEGDRGRLDVALASHWRALEHYRQAPHPGARIGDQQRNLALAYDLMARLGPEPGAARTLAARLRAQARASLTDAGDTAALAEVDLTEAAGLLATDPDAALHLALPAALARDAPRFGLPGRALRGRWSDAEATAALDLALAAAERSGRADLAAALVVCRRVGGITEAEPPPEAALGESDVSTQRPPPRIAGTDGVLEPWWQEAHARYGVPLDQLRTELNFDLSRPAGR